MEKQAILRVEPATVGRYALGGLVIGASSAALISLMRMIREMRERAKEEEEPTETTENTIVLTLPEKKGMIEGPGGGTPGADASNAHALTAGQPAPSVTTSKAPAVSSSNGPVGRQPRRHDGTASFSTVGYKAGEILKHAAGWPTLTASALAAVGGGTLGYMVVNKIYEMRRQKMLEDELSATQEEYLQSIQQPEKSAMWKDILPFEKQAIGESFGFLNYPIAAAVLLGLLGTSGTAYITKKILDEKLEEASREGLELPKVRRIVFKTRKALTPQEEAKPELQGTPEDVETVKAALAIMLDVVNDKTLVLAQPYVKEAMAKVGQTPGSMMGQATDTDKLMEYLRGTPELRKMLIRAAMESHPFLKHFKWGYNIPGVKQLMDKQLYSRVGDALNPKPLMQDAARAIGGSEGRTPMASAEEKQAQLAEGALSSFLGNTLAGNDPKALVQALVAAQLKSKSEEAKSKKMTPAETSDIQLVAKDPAAKSYLAKNKEKVLAILRQMATEGKL